MPDSTGGDGELDRAEAALLAEMVALGADHFHVGADGKAVFSKEWPEPRWTGIQPGSWGICTQAGRDVDVAASQGDDTVATVVDPP